MNKTDIPFLERLVYETFLVQKFSRENSRTLVTEKKKFILPLTSDEKKSKHKSTKRLNKTQGISHHFPTLRQLPLHNTHDYLRVDMAPLPHHSRTEIKLSSIDCTQKDINATVSQTNLTDISNLQLECFNRTKEQKKLWECPICLEQSKGQEIVATVCGHVFCRGCIQECLRQSTNSQCPSCRFNIGTYNFITLYNI